MAETDRPLEQWRPCRHRCKSKETCKHRCCKVGVRGEAAAAKLAPFITEKDQLELGLTLAESRFATVYKACCQGTGRLLAVKVTATETLEKEERELAYARELEIHSSIAHPHIVQYCGHYSDDAAHYLVTEFASGGDLYHHMLRQPTQRLGESITLHYLHQVSQALCYCHEQGIIHRDVKPDNILLFKGDVVKLADFGWAVRHENVRRTTLCGTLDYLAPEMVDNATYDQSLDTWCLGVTLYELMVGTPPFICDTYRETYRNIAQLKLSVPPGTFSSGACALLLQMLKLASGDRPSMQQVEARLASMVQSARPLESGKN